MPVRTRSTLVLVIVLLIGAVVAAAAPKSHLLVVCAPGSAGTTEEAQPRMDAFAAALAAKAKTDVKAVYEPSDAGGVKRFANATLGIISLPFFVEHEKALGLHARLGAVQAGRPALESWTLVAQKGRITKADQLASFSIVSTAAFAPTFVRRAVGKLGTLPDSVKLVQSTQVLSALRRAANGEPVAVLLDGPQASALASLPFASKLDVVTRSPAWPVGLVVSVDRNLPDKAWSPLESAFLALGSDQTGSAALAGLMVEKFVPLDNRVLSDLRRTVPSTP